MSSALFRASQLLPQIVAVFLTASTPVLADSLMTDEAVSSDLTAVNGLRSDLHRAVGSKEQSAPEYVTVTLFGGIPPPIESTFTAKPLAGGLWIVEQIFSDIDYKSLTRLPPEKRDVVLSTADSRKIIDILTQVSLYEEPGGRAGNCTDQPLIGVEIAFQGKRRQALRTSCPEHDLTEQLIEAIVVPLRDRKS